MKQTSVEWLYSKWSEQATLYLEDLEQAKAMEKEQIIEAYKADCDTLGHDSRILLQSSLWRNTNIYISYSFSRRYN